MTLISCATLLSAQNCLHIPGEDFVNGKCGVLVWSGDITLIGKVTKICC